MGNFWAAAAQTTQFQHNRAHLGPIYPITNLPIYPICSAGYNQLRPLSGSNSVVECDLAKVEVAGSNPVSRSKKSQKFPATPRRGEGLCSQGFLSVGRGTQVVRERSAKPLCVGSIPTRASTQNSRMSQQQYGTQPLSY